MEHVDANWFLLEHVYAYVGHHFGIATWLGTSARFLFLHPSLFDDLRAGAYITSEYLADQNYQRYLRGAENVERQCELRQYRISLSRQSQGRAARFFGEYDPEASDAASSAVPSS